MCVCVYIYIYISLNGVDQWTECWPENPQVMGSIPSQGMCLDCGPGPQLETCERQLIDVFVAHQCFSPSLSPSLPLSLKINTYNLKTNTYTHKFVYILVPKLCPAKTQVPLLLPEVRKSSENSKFMFSDFPEPLT